MILLQWILRSCYTYGDQAVPDRESADTVDLLKLIRILSAALSADFLFYYTRKKLTVSADIIRINQIRFSAQERNPAG